MSVNSIEKTISENPGLVTVAIISLGSAIASLLGVIGGVTRKHVKEIEDKVEKSLKLHAEHEAELTEFRFERTRALADLKIELIQKVEDVHNCVLELKGENNTEHVAMVKTIESLERRMPNGEIRELRQTISDLTTVVKRLTE